MSIVVFTLFANTAIILREEEVSHFGAQPLLCLTQNRGFLRYEAPPAGAVLDFCEERLFAAVSQTLDQAGGACQRQRQEEYQQSHQDRADGAGGGDTHCQKDSPKQGGTQNARQQHIESRAQAAAFGCSACQSGRHQQNAQINHGDAKCHP